MLDLFHFSMLIPATGRDRNKNEASARAAAELLALAHLEAPEVLARLQCTPEGLNPEQVEERLAEFGANVVAQEKKKPFLLQILERFITNPINVTYLTGFSGDSSYVILTRDKSLIISDMRYGAQIKEECPGLDAFIRGPALPLSEATIGQLTKFGPRNIGYESGHLTVADFQTFADGIKTGNWKPSSDRVEKLRQIKDDVEIAQIREAIKIAEKAFAMAGLTPSAIDVASLYDCYTITVLMTLEDAGFCGKGEGMKWLTEHDLTFRGDFPLNTAGGQLSFGQAGMAGGMHHVCDGTRQVMGRAGAAQVRDCNRAFVSGNGGIMSEQVALILQGD